jgi:hypothetical protein
VITMTVPLPPNAANSRRHWRTAQREKKAYWQALRVLQRMRQIPPPPVAPYDRASISVHLYVHNYMDSDNAAARLKPLLDWLQPDYIADDSYRALEWAGVPAQTIDRRNPRVVLTLAPRMEAAS